ncbi:MAG TPA: VCBS repeat-containing protein [Chitinophagaceae bacterium]|nr:VCBS repeat-containing protein [Chitinophagaceae bacterium]
MKILSTLFTLISFVFLLVMYSCKNKSSLFQPVSSSHSNIHFINKIEENDSLNPIDVTNIYNGGGVGVGDFNNDGLQDLYFTGNLVPNKLYLNKGKFKFEDVTKEAGVDGSGRWCRGVAIVDINNDGLLDMYVSASMSKDVNKRKNLLYVNQGADKNGIPKFREIAAEYGLADTTHSTMAAFFDYDNDGDLDMYLVVNQILEKDIPSNFRPKITDGSYPSTGRLYRNDWNDSIKHPIFTNVSKQAGITIEGYGHGVSIADFNKDGWKDIFVTNDFNSNDLLYINNHDGTFTDKASVYFKHTSANGMGQDVIDINNDGFADVVELDMNPEDNYRKKTMMGSGSYQTYQNSDYYGYQYQYVRNSIQLNQGPRISQSDSIGDPIFSDIGFLSGIAETDWSWTPIVTDFDNDGFRDIIVTNGFPKDITDHDFMAFRRTSFSLASKEYMLAQIPEVKLHNYAFHNNNNLTFQNVTDKWGLEIPSFSNGAAYADLDNDGDMDCVINNINDESFVYENTTNSKDKIAANFLQIKFKGNDKNLNGLGASAEIYYRNQIQVYENSPYRGYLSSVDAKAFFGLGNVAVIDSVIIKWPGNKKQVLKDVKTNQLLAVDIQNANLDYDWTNTFLVKNSLFTDFTNMSGINYQHQETDIIDFDKERLIPHKLSQYGPGLAAGDIDGNGLDDICIGGPADFPGKFLLQQTNGKFIMKDMPSANNKPYRKAETMGMLLFDADNDGDPDLYCANGSNEFPANTENYQDWFFINDGKGNFTNDSSALPINYTSKSCIRATDFDNDGDLDLFIGGRCLPGKYPLPVSSFIYRNDSKNGQIKFTDVTSDVVKDLQNIGMVCDALWTDFDNDGWTDLLVVGEWMPVTFFKNNHGKFENTSAQSGINTQTGWWNSIISGDFDNDGDIDYIAGNLGENSFFRASDQYPVNVYAKDFDKNGSLDAIVTVFLKDKNGEKKEYTALNRDDIVSQLPPLKKKFLTYKDFANADIHQLFTAEEMNGALILHANNFKSSYIKNNGNGKFELYALPPMAQIGPLNGMIAEDFNGDGNLDVAITGNDYGNEVSDGRYDALNGIVLLGDGAGNFTAQTILQSGFYVPGDAKALVKLRGANNNYFLAASQNRGPLKLFTSNSQNQKVIPLQPFDVSAILTYRSGKKQKNEINYGSSFLSQSSRFLNVDNNIVSVEIKNSKGNMRKVSLQ